MKKLLIALAASASVFAGVSAAQAAEAEVSTTNDTQLNVIAHFQPGCTLTWDNNKDTVEFGPFSDVNQLTPQTFYFSIGCSKGNQTAQVKLTAGMLNPTDMPSARKLYANGDKGQEALSYNIYKGSTISDPVWGDGTDSALPYDVTATDIASATHKPFTVAVARGQTINATTQTDYRNTVVAQVVWATK